VKGSNDRNFASVWLRAQTEAIVAIVGACVLLLLLVAQFGRDTLHSTVLAYTLFGLGILGTVAWNLIVRSPRATRDTQLRLMPILFLALTVRLIAAQSPGFEFDLSINKGWAQSAAQLGLARSYNEQLGGNVLPNYPPLMITLYWLAGTLYQFAISPLFDSLRPDFNVVIRFPAIAADLAACVVVAMVARKAGARQKWTLAAWVYALHPVVIYDTGVWGQSDGIYAVLMLVALYAASRERWLMAGIWTACALLTKPQAAAMLPVLLVTGVRQLPRSAVFFGGALLAGISILLPFILGGSMDAVFAVYARTVGGYYRTVSIGAYNFWEIFHRTARNGDDGLALNLLTFRSAGLLLFASATMLVLWQLRAALVAPRDERQHLIGVLLAGALTTSAMFIFATEMHERYQFAYVLLALPVAVVSGTGAVLYAATCCLILLNLLGQFAFGAVDMALFRMVPALSKIIGVLQVVLFFITVHMAPKIADARGERNN
jgi:Gpi18-like mannosyltransferase